MKNWDFGYFGKGIDGYVHYKQAFDRNFPQNQQTHHSSQHTVRQKPSPEKKEDGSDDDTAAFVGIFVTLFFLDIVLLTLQLLLQSLP